jgi:hypothetical protein
MLVKFMVIGNIVRPLGIFILRSFGNLVAISYTFSRFGILHHEKSGNPGRNPTPISDTVSLRHVKALDRSGAFYLLLRAAKFNVPERIVNRPSRPRSGKKII